MFSAPVCICVRIRTTRTSDILDSRSRRKDYDDIFTGDDLTSLHTRYAALRRRRITRIKRPAYVRRVRPDIRTIRFRWAGRPFAFLRPKTYFCGCSPEPGRLTFEKRNRNDSRTFTVRAPAGDYVVYSIYFRMYVFCFEKSERFPSELYEFVFRTSVRHHQ